MNLPDDLQPGDILLYYTAGNTVSEAIAFAEGIATMRRKVSHVEFYAGNGKSWASRDGTGPESGVNEYPFRTLGLVTVRRPYGTPDMVRAAALFGKIKGTPYGGLTNGDNLLQIGEDIPNGTINCSHTTALLTDAARVPQFVDASEFDRRYITPAHFLMFRNAQTIWNAA